MANLIELKATLLQYCLDLKMQSEVNLMAAITEAQQAANEYGAPKDRYDSFRTQQMRKRDMLAQQLAVVAEEIRFLQQLKSAKACDTVMPGALVKLLNQTLLIAVGIGKIELNGQVYYAISPVVPLVEAMKNKKAGDKFTFRGATLEILEVA